MADGFSRRAVLPLLAAATAATAATAAAAAAYLSPHEVMHASSVGVEGTLNAVRVREREERRRGMGWDGIARAVVVKRAQQGVEGSPDAVNLASFFILFSEFLTHQRPVRPMGLDLCLLLCVGAWVRMGLGLGRESEREGVLGEN
jgi:hypothetical protein